ncbi:MAG: hypothetical protein V7L27_04735 [Nostoc sp.]|uniref:hypothetical protein n=1 Tax=Nostoc sp. TaxID=1180 RepID=UPI002FF8027D
MQLQIQWQLNSKPCPVVITGNSRFVHFFWSSRNCRKTENLGVVMVLAIPLNLP